MKQKRTKSTLFAFLLPVLLFSSCAPGEESGLSDGKYPMTFTAQVDGGTATRATSDNSWAGGEDVTVQIGSEVKTYTAASDGNLTVASSDTPFYWQNTNDITVSAWYPYSAEKPVADALTVKADQSNNTNYQASDYLEADKATVTFQNPTLAFKHRTAKVIVTLKAGGGVTDISGATVKFLNQIGVDGGGTEVTPKKETADGSTIYAALVIPKQMKGEKFIQVTVGTGDAARDYFYTPTGTNDANLEAGKQYTYTITVKKTGLEVQVTGNGVSWDDVPITSTPAESITYQITAPTSAGITITAGDGCALEGSSGSYTLSGGNAIIVTVDAGGNSDKFLKGIPVKGIYDIKSISFTDGSYSYTYTLKGDISFSAPSFSDKTTPTLGDYYYFDGTWSAELWEKPCIGIVFKAGAGENDNVSNYAENTFADNTIHGYVVALTNTGNERKSWGNISDISLNTDNTKFYGYSNTQAIQKASGYNETDFWACYRATNYSPAVPSSGTSGWYLPSLGEYNALWQVYGKIQNKLTTAGGTDMKMSWGLYWTSSKKESSAACVDFGAWSNSGSFVNAVRTEDAHVRPVLTF